MSAPTHAAPVRCARQPAASVSASSHAAPLAIDPQHGRRPRRAPPWIGAAISARPPVSAVTTWRWPMTLSIEILRHLQLRGLVRAPRRGDRRRPPARRGEHERAMRLERGPRGIARGARDGIAARRRLGAQAIAELRERREVAARAIVAAGQREQLAARDLHRDVARRARHRDALDRQVGQLRRAEHDLVAGLEPVRRRPGAPLISVRLAAVVDPAQRAVAQLDQAVLARHGRIGELDEAAVLAADRAAAHAAARTRGPRRGPRSRRGGPATCRHLTAVVASGMCAREARSRLLLVAGGVQRRQARRPRRPARAAARRGLRQEDRRCRGASSQHGRRPTSSWSDHRRDRQADELSARHATRASAS